MRGAPLPALAWRLLRLRPGEGAPAALFGLVGGLLQMGVAVGFTAADALFLTQVGVRGLPAVYLLTPAIMVVYVPLHAWAMGRVGIDRVLAFTLAVVAGGSAAVWWAVGSAPGPLTFYAAKLFTALWWIALYSLFWNWVDGFFDIQDAKRLFALFGAGEAMGGVAGGVLAAFLVRVRPVQDLFLVWSVLALLAIPAAALVRRRRHRLEEPREEGSAGGFAERTRRTLTSVRTSSFVLILGAALVVGLFVVTVTEYQYLGILSQGVGEEELASLLGTLLALVSVFSVAANLFFFNRLVLGIGVRNVALVPAGAYLLAFALLLLEGGPAAAAFGFFTYHAVLPSIEYNNQNFLFHAVPDAVRREVRTLLEGLAEPMATALGGAFLFLAASRMSPIQISTAGLAVATLYLGLVLLVRRGYGPSLVANLRRRWLDLSRPSEEVLTGLSVEEVATLRRYTCDPDADIALSALRILWMNDCGGAVEATLRYLRERPDGDRQKARELLGHLLDSATPEAAHPLVEWILAHIRELGPGFVEDLGARGLVPASEVEPLLASSDPDDVAAAAVVLWRTSDPRGREAALGVLRHLLEDHAPAARAAGLRVLGTLPGDPLSRWADASLDDPDPRVRAAAVAAVRGTAAPGSTELVEPLLHLVSEPGRLAFPALEALARVADPRAIPRLLRRSEGLTPNVRRVVVRTLDRMGLRGVPQSVAAIRDPGIPYAGRILAARSLSRLAPAQLETLVPEIQRIEVARAEQCRSHGHVLAGLDGAGASVLRRYYRDEQVRVTDYVLELLSVVGRVPDWDMLRRWLRGGTADERADALETLDQALGRREFAHLAPLLASDQTRPQPAGEMPVIVLLERTLRARLGIASAAAARALWSLEPDRARSLAPAVLRSEPQRILRDTLLDLIAPEPDGGPGTVTVLHALETARLFGEVPLADAKALVLAGAVHAMPVGGRLVQKGEVPAQVPAVVEGAARVPSGAIMGPGSLVAASDLLAGRPAREDVASLGCRVLSVPLAAIQAAAERSPDVAHAVFALREEGAHASAA